MKFSLKTLLILVTICALVVGFGCFAYQQFNAAMEKEVAGLMGEMLFEPIEALPQDNSKATDESQVIFGDPIIETITGKVVGVYDGDLLTLLVNKKEIKVRLAAIDTPERRGGQPFSKAAKQFLSDSVFGKTVQIQKVGDAGWDRDLGYVVADGVNVNAELIKQGLAWHYKEYSDDETLARFELDAREAKRGLWVDVEPVPPWEFRNLKLDNALE